MTHFSYLIRINVKFDLCDINLTLKIFSHLGSWTIVIHLLCFTVVDECSPPKAKRVMLPASQSQQSAVRVDRRGNVHSAKNTFKSVGVTPTKSRLTPSKSKSFSESTSFNNSLNSVKHLSRNSVQSSTKLSKSLTCDNSPVSKGILPTRRKSSRRRSASVGSSIDFETDDSPDLEELTKSRFAKVNDTITKSKKFSKLHTNTVLPSGKSKSRRSLIDEESSDLDGTFTIDPASNNIPPSVIPCVDCVSEYTRSKDTVITLLSVKPCNKCVKDEEMTSQSIRKNGDCYCTEIEPAQKYTTCIDSLQTGSQSEYGPENDSGTSTIVDQSANSVASLASVSTLVDGQNLSQDISQSEENSQNIPANRSQVQINDARVDNKCSRSVGMNCGHINSGTVTKISSTSGSLLQTTVTKTSTTKEDSCNGDNKAVRAIMFEKEEKASTPSKGMMIKLISFKSLRRKRMLD